MASIESSANKPGKEGKYPQKWVRQTSSKRIPRGRCLPPIPPVPNPRRGELMSKQESQPQSRNRASKRQPHIVVWSKGGEPHQRKPLPKWRMEYVRFKRKVKSSLFMPLILLLAVGGVGLHTVGLIGAANGYFTWSVACEGVVTVVGESGRASGEQTYSIGWARYSGTGPSTASDTAVLGSNSTEVNGLGGVAGSSIPNQGWLADIETTSTTLGASTALAHILGLGFYGIALATAVHLFRSQFSCKRPLFRPAAKASGALFVWLVGIGVAGFYLAIKEKFEEKIIATLNSEGFLCEDDSTLSGEYAYISTGFGCVASALMSFLTWKFGQAADLVLADFPQQKG